MSTLFVIESRRLRTAVKEFLVSHHTHCKTVRDAMSHSQRAVSNSWYMARLIKEYLREKDEARKRGLGIRIAHAKGA